MGMIVACPRDDNTKLQICKTMKGLTFSVEGSTKEFIPLYCDYCCCLIWIDIDSISQDGDIWRYKER